MRPRGPPFGTCRGYRDTRQPIPQGPASAPRNPPETVDARVYNPSVACDANTTHWMIARHLASPPCRDTVDQRPRGSMHAVPVHDPYEAPADEVNGQAEPDQLSPSLRKPANGGGTAPKPRCGRLVNRVQQRTESVMPRARGHSLQATAEVNRPAFGDPFHRNRFSLKVPSTYRPSVQALTPVHSSPATSIVLVRVCSARPGQPRHRGCGDQPGQPVGMGRCVYASDAWRCHYDLSKQRERRMDGMKYGDRETE